MSDNTPVLSCVDLCKSYREGPRELPVLSKVNLAIRAGETVAITGQSGSGKTTLLNMLGGLDQPDAGEVLVDGRSLSDIGEAERCRLRNASLGFVYQLHHLLMEFTALENAAMPLLIGGTARRQALAEAGAMLERTGLGERLHHRPSELSGGERQRVAVARALVAKPRCVLMDEPTGNLDSDTGQRVLDLLLALNKDLGCSLVIVTHDAAIAAAMGRTLALKSGTLVDA